MGFYTKLIVLIVIIVLGALGYLEKIFHVKISRVWRVVFLVVFIIFSVAQVKIFIDSYKKTTSLEVELREKTSQRRLKPDQTLSLRRELSRFEKRYPVVFACRRMDTESCNYAEDLASVFREANWNVGDVNRTFLDDIEGDLTLTTTHQEQKVVVDQLAMVL